MRRKLAMLSIGAVALSIAATGCTSNTTSDTGGTPAPKQAGVISTDPKDSQGPAAPVTGAVKGGNLNILQNSDFDHLDSARSYVNVQQVVGTLITRSLTTYKELPQADGSVKMTIVGDLATTPGLDVNKDCKVWKYTLKDNIKFEDGTPIKASDFVYGIARSFSPQLAEGPHYIQNWLSGTGATTADYEKTYKGPYDGGGLTVPGLTAPDDKTVVFTFPKAECDMPYAAALPMTSPVPQAKDTKLEYDRHPISSGPYMISEYTKDTTLKLVRNPSWDPTTDAVHNAYPDTLTFTLNLDSQAINQRLIADAPADQNAITWVNVNAEVAAQVTGPVKTRVIDGATQFADYLYINTARVTDLNVRKAINTGLDKTAVLKAVGGSLAGSVLNTIASPTTAGWKDYNAFGVGATGDSAKAKALLGSSKADLTLCYAQSTRRQNQAIAIQDSLKKSGFNITLKPVDAATYYTILGKKGNTCDLYRGGWGSDWPSGSTIIPPILDGRAIQDEGNQNLSYFNEPTVNSEIDRISGEDPSKAADDWAALDKKIMTDYAPLVPVFNNRNYTLIGSKVGGAFLSSAFGVTSLNTIFVKS